MKYELLSNQGSGKDDSADEYVPFEKESAHAFWRGMVVAAALYTVATGFYACKEFSSGKMHWGSRNSASQNSASPVGQTRGGDACSTTRHFQGRISLESLTNEKCESPRDDLAKEMVVLDPAHASRDQ
ncbi:hypothetical protein D6783_04790 [Candidatus Woesearchaeota archaeon]|nr:MAG: hypothetical protein D6783_04790 [Candidatus Woesearchaeota archaeon]